MKNKKIRLGKGGVFAAPLSPTRALIGQIIYVDYTSDARGKNVSDSESDCFYVNIRTEGVDIPVGPCGVEKAMESPVIYKGFMCDVDIGRGNWFYLGERAIPSDSEVEEVLQITPKGFIVENLEREFIRNATRDDMRTLRYRRYRLSTCIGKEIRKSIQGDEVE